MFTKTEAFPGENFYTQVPTHWLRDPFLGAPAKAVLSYWQSHAIGYRVTIEQTIAEMAEGRDFVYAAVRDALDRGYLVRLQGRGGRGRFGSVEYTYGPAAFTQSYVRNWGRRPDGTEGPVDAATVDQSAAAPPAAPVDNSTPADVSAGGTAYGFAGSGRTGNGAAGYGATGYGPTASGESDTKKINPLKDQSLSSCTSEEDQNPPPLSAVNSLAPEREADSGGDSESLSETEKMLLNAAVEKAIAIRSGRDGWSQQAIVAAMQAQLGEHSVHQVAAVIVRAAEDVEGTQYPGRIGYLLKQAARPVSAPPAGLAQGAPELGAELGRKHLPVGTPMCPRHRGEPAHCCNPCAAETKGAQVDAESVVAAPRLDAAAARELARRNAASASTRPVRLSRGPWMPPQAPEQPNGLDRLREAAPPGAAPGSEATS
jgi:hypothetical protein